MTSLAAVGLIGIGLASLGIAAAIKRRGTVADVYGGARLAPYYMWMMVVFGIALAAIGVANLVS